MKLRWKILIWVVAICSLPAALVVWNYWPMGRVTLVISPETTYITESLTADGYPDYAAAINARLAAGTRPEDNAAIDILHAVGIDLIPEAYRAEALAALGVSEADFANDPPPFEPFEDFLARLTAETGLEYASYYDIAEAIDMGEGTIDDYPHMRMWLDENEAAIDRYLRAADRPLLYWPILSVQNEQMCDPFRQVRGRWLDVAMYGLSLRWLAAKTEGDAFDVLMDYVTCVRLARAWSGGVSAHVLELGAMGTLRAFSADAINEGALSRDELVRLQNALRDLPELPPLSVSVETDRLVTLMVLISQWRRGEPTDRIGGLRVWPIDWVAVDINLVLREVNEALDANQQVFACGTYSQAACYAPVERDAAEHFTNMMTLYQREREGTEHLERGRRGRAAYTQPIADEIVLYLVGDIALQLYTNHARSVGCERLLELAVALQLYKLDEGEYPDSLGDLVTKYIDEVPVDPFNDESMRYLRVGAGCLVYSVGENQIDEEGQGWDFRPLGTDGHIRDADDITVALGVPSVYDD
jgi:hypothetical protein